MEFFSYELLLTFITLTFLEIVLGIDNIIFIAIAIHNLPDSYRRKARNIGIALALGIRIVMLMGIAWVMSFNKPLFTIGNFGFSLNNILLIIGGIFLIIKSGLEIYKDISLAREGKDADEEAKKNTTIHAKNSFMGAVLQIAVIDFVFSFDSIITAIGMTRNLPIIISAVVISMLVMLFGAKKISKILHMYPSLKIIALAFIFMIGVILLADGLHFPINKAYLYFSLFFASAVEILNIMANTRKR